MAPTTGKTTPSNSELMNIFGGAEVPFKGTIEQQMQNQYNTRGKIKTVM